MMPRKVQNMLTQFYRWWPNMAHVMWKKFVSSGEGESFNNLNKDYFATNQHIMDRFFPVMSGAVGVSYAKKSYQTLGY